MELGFTSEQSNSGRYLIRTGSKPWASSVVTNDAYGVSSSYPDGTNILEQRLNPRLFGTTAVETLFSKPSPDG